VNQQSELRDFLASRRAKLTPQEVGVPTYGGRRRVPGLRREEVAHLAGVSVDYYTRLERGRTTGASPEVLDAVATALRLSPVERAHLLELVGFSRPSRVRKARTAARAQVRSSLQSALDAMSVPALVNNERQDMIATNHLARAIYPHATENAGVPFNHSRFQFLDPRARDFYVDYDLATRNNVALLRAAAGHHPFDEELIRLVGQLSTQSEAFRVLWASHDVIEYQHGLKRYRHPVVGDLSFDFESFQMPTDPGLTMLIYTAQPGSPTEEALRILESWTTVSPTIQTPAHRSERSTRSTPTGSAESKPSRQQESPED
jgi:transcriptional regulator with XRE-family HTH domain